MQNAMARVVPLSLHWHSGRKKRHVGYHGIILKQAQAAAWEGLLGVEGALLRQRLPVWPHDHIPLLVDRLLLEQPQCILLQIETQDLATQHFSCRLPLTSAMECHGFYVHLLSRAGLQSCSSNLHQERLSRTALLMCAF